MKKVKRMMFGGISKAAGKTLGQVSKMPGGVNQNAPADVQKMMANLPRGSTVAAPKPAPMPMGGTRPPGLGTTGGPLVKPLPPGIKLPPDSGMGNKGPSGLGVAGLGGLPAMNTSGPLIKPNQTPLQGVNPTVGRLPQAGSKPTPPSMVDDILKTAQAKGMLGPAPVGIGSSSAQANPRMMSGLSGMGAALGKRMGMKKGGAVKKKASSYKSGGSVSSASKRADGIAVKGKTKGRMV